MRKKKRWILGVLVLVAVVPSVLIGWFFVPFMTRVEHFSASPNSGYHADFYLYISPGALRRTQQGEKLVVLVQPNNSGTNSDDPTVHRTDAWWTSFGRHGLANELEVALVVPAFVRPAEEWTVYTHALDRDVLTTDTPVLSRTDLQLLAMVDQVKQHVSQENIVLDSQILIQGYSASGMFANRFAFLHPDRVKAVAAGSPGGWPIAPIDQYQNEPLPYPAGVADLEELTGQSLDLAALQSVPQLIVMGDQDDNDSVDFGDGWDKTAAEQLERLFGEQPIDRWNTARAIYKGRGMNVEFVLVPGIGHDRHALQGHTTEFFKRVLGR